MADLASITKREDVEDDEGRVVRRCAHFDIPTLRSRFSYKLDYPPGAADSAMDDDLVKLADMSLAQDSRQRAMDAIQNTEVTANGLTALITDASVHIEKPGECYLFVVFYVREKNRWVKLKHRGETPNDLPGPAAIKAAITKRLQAFGG